MTKPLLYKAEFPKSFKKSIKKIPTDSLNSCKKAITDCLDNPKSKSDKVKDPNLPDRKIRVGNYRILFDIDEDERIIYVIAIKHRKECYE